MAIQLACEKIQKQRLKNLRRQQEDFKQILKSNDVTQIAEADVHFHDIFSGNRQSEVDQLLSNLREQMYRYRLEYLKRESVYPKLIVEHEEIIHFIQERTRRRRQKWSAVILIIR